MKKYLSLLVGAALVLGFTSCAMAPANNRTNYIAPSVGPTRSAVSGAQTKIKSAQKHAAASAAFVQQAAARAKSVTDRLKVLATATAGRPEHSIVLQVQSDVDALTTELLGVKNENTGLAADLIETQKDLITAQTALAQLQTAASTQTTLLNTANTNLNTEIVRGKKNADIVAAVNKGWGLGAFAYGVKRLLSHLLWLALGIVVLVVALVILATIFPAFGAVFGVVMSFIRMIFDRIGSAGRSSSLSPIVRYPHIIPPRGPTGVPGLTGSPPAPPPSANDAIINPPAPPLP